MQAVSDGSGRDRKLLRRARELLVEAGWKPRGSQLVNDKGEAFAVEMMAEEESLARIAGPFVENMQAIGIGATIRMVDSAQYQARQVDFDFDMLMMAQSFTATPTRDQLFDTFHSRAARAPGTRNYPGTASPAIDALIDIAGRAKTRDELVAAVRALDRVLRARRDWIPNWYAPNHRSAFWDMFGFKEPKPDYGFPVEQLWWIDEEKARAIGKA
jgi:microcin C transport system substrate-binding protein